MSFFFFFFLPHQQPNHPHIPLYPRAWILCEGGALICRHSCQTKSHFRLKCSSLSERTRVCATGLGSFAAIVTSPLHCNYREHLLHWHKHMQMSIHGLKVAVIVVILKKKKRRSESFSGFADLTAYALKLSCECLYSFFHFHDQKQKVVHSQPDASESI